MSFKIIPPPPKEERIRVSLACTVDSHIMGYIKREARANKCSRSEVIRQMIEYAYKEAVL